MREEIGKVRAAVAKRTGRRFSPEVRRQIAAVGRRLHTDGASWRLIGAELGVAEATVQRLCTQGATGFNAVEIVDDAPVSGIVLVTPGGFRVEGLTPASAADLVRKLS